MTEQTKNSIIITPENIDSVMFKGVKVHTKLTTSFDNDAKKAKQSAKIDVIVDLTDAFLSDVMPYTAADFRVKVNSRLKNDAHDSTSYLAMLERKKHKVEFTLADLETKRETDPVAQASNNVAKFETRGQIVEFSKRGGLDLTDAQIDALAKRNGII